MTDTERLNLVEHYKWFINNNLNEWMVVGSFPGYVTAPTLRVAIETALTAQINWSLDK